MFACFSKIIKKLIHKRLSFFEKHPILVKTLYEFQANKSTSHAILDVLMTAYEHINNRVDRFFTFLLILNDVILQ